MTENTPEQDEQIVRQWLSEHTAIAPDVVALVLAAMVPRTPVRLDLADGYDAGYALGYDEALTDVRRSMALAVLRIKNQE